MAQTIPSHLKNDKHWRGVLFLFSNHSKLQQYFTTKYFDFNAERIKTTTLKKASAPWSQSEKFMLDLALHLYNERNKVNLGDMDYLDQYNLELAFKAMRMRYA